MKIIDKVEVGYIVMFFIITDFCCLNHIILLKAFDWYPESVTDFRILVKRHMQPLNLL